jgi:glutamate 5-kinase
VTEALIVVVKVGTSSVTLPGGGIDSESIFKLAREVAAVGSSGHRVVLVTSGAVTAGVAAGRSCDVASARVHRPAPAHARV